MTRETRMEIHARLRRSEGPRRSSILSTPQSLHQRVRGVYLSSHPALAVALAPAREFLQAQPVQQTFAIGAGILSAIWGYAFIPLLLLSIGASMMDYFIGRARARRELGADGLPRFQPDVASIGYAVKVSTYAQLSLLWGAEVWVWTRVLPLLSDVGVSLPGWVGQLVGGGWVATGLLFGFFVTEMDSVEAHKVAMGRGRLPGWSIISGALRGLLERGERVIERLMGGPPPPPPPTGGGPGGGRTRDISESDVRRAAERRRGPPPVSQIPRWLSGTEN